MAREFEYPYTSLFEFNVEVDESGQPYAERKRAGRVVWLVFGLLVAGIAGWFLLSSDGPDWRQLSTAIPAVIGLFAIVGVAAELVFGSDRSRVIEDGGRYYLKMLTCSRWYVGAAGVALAATGVSTFLSVRAPDVLGSAGPQQGSSIVALAETIPFGEFVLLFVAVVLAVIALQKAVAGRLLIVQK